jgi:hypothetical protein
MRRFALLPHLAFALPLGALAAAGCVLVTGSTDGYELADAGGASEVEAGTCIAEGGICFDLQCASRADCDAGQVCCLGLTGETCQASCTLESVQLCASDVECGDAGPCIQQQCDTSTATYSGSLCGLVPGCVEVAPAPEAGASDANHAGD